MQTSTVKNLSFWLPTKDSLTRWLSLMMEMNLHRRPRVGGPSLSELVWTSGEVARALSELPEATTPEVRASMVVLVAPWPKGRYGQALKRSGGILNLFRPLWRGQQEPVWDGMLSAWRSGGAKRPMAPPLELQHAWNHTPLPLLGGMTPAQAMVGVGPQEAALTREFLTDLERSCGERGFADEAEALQVSVNLLTDWREGLRADGAPLLETVFAERSALLARRAELMAERR